MIEMLIPTLLLQYYFLYQNIPNRNSFIFYERLLSLMLLIDYDFLQFPGYY